MWGVAASTMETVALPLPGDSWSAFLVLLFWTATAWSIVGVGIAWLVECADWRLERPLFLAASVVIGALAFSALASWIFSIKNVPGPALGIDIVLPNGRDALGSYLYQAWNVAFYGGLYTVAWTFNQRAERMRALLGQAQIARLRSETLLAEVQLQALRGHIDPNFLLRVVQVVEGRYANAPASADRLVVLLVAFLRRAMPAVRSGASTLAAELSLARTYADLYSDLEPSRPTWATEIRGTPPGLAFPPLLLLPVLDQLSAASTTTERGRICVSCAGDSVSIAFYGELAAKSGWLAPDLAYRIRVGLSTRFGTQWSMSLRDGAEVEEPALLLRIGPSHDIIEQSVV